MLTSESYVDAMKQFSDTMKSCVTIASAALIFPITVLRATSTDSPLEFNAFLVIAWFSLGLAVVCGLVYQVISARRIARTLGLPSRSIGGLSRPENFYNATLIALIVGILLLVMALVS
ncbi:hypothetical protein [Ruegeria hyattellae]|uniref:hypothetical protein n=1 Tax=Ruegeria hyattellae TaxID=3233337 RepID=UPI00355AFB26